MDLLSTKLPIENSIVGSGKSFTRMARFFCHGFEGIVSGEICDLLISDFLLLEELNIRLLSV